jgi:hypothetical protein
MVKFERTLAMPLWNAVVDVYKEMAEWKGHVLGGVDGKKRLAPMDLIM